MDNSVLARAALRYSRIFDVLKRSQTPLSSEELYDRPDVRELCKGKHNVSDALAAMHKKGLIARAPSGVGRSKYLYEISSVSTPSQGAGKEAVNKTPRILALIPTVEVLLSPMEFSGFLKGILILHPEESEEILGRLNELTRAH